LSEFESFSNFNTLANIQLQPKHEIGIHEIDAAHIQLLEHFKAIAYEYELSKQPKKNQLLAIELTKFCIELKNHFFHEEKHMKDCGISDETIHIHENEHQQIIKELESNIVDIVQDQLIMTETFFSCFATSILKHILNTDILLKSN
jgi:hemerythrin